MLSFKNSALK